MALLLQLLCHFICIILPGIFEDALNFQQNFRAEIVELVNAVLVVDGLRECLHVSVLERAHAVSNELLLPGADESAVDLDESRQHGLQVLETALARGNDELAQERVVEVVAQRALVDVLLHADLSSALVHLASLLELILLA